MHAPQRRKPKEKEGSDMSSSGVSARLEVRVEDCECVVRYSIVMTGRKKLTQKSN